MVLGLYTCIVRVGRPRCRPSLDAATRGDRLCTAADVRFEPAALTNDRTACAVRVTSLPHSRAWQVRLRPDGKGMREKARRGAAMGLTVEPRHRYSVATGTAHRSAGIRGEGPPDGTRAGAGYTVAEAV